MASSVAEVLRRRRHCGVPRLWWSQYWEAVTIRCLGSIRRISNGYGDPIGRFSARDGLDWRQCGRLGHRYVVKRKTSVADQRPAQSFQDPDALISAIRGSKTVFSKPKPPISVRNGTVSQRIRIRIRWKFGGYYWDPLRCQKHLLPGIAMQASNGKGTLVCG